LSWNFWNHCFDNGSSLSC